LTFAWRGSARVKYSFIKKALGLYKD